MSTWTSSGALAGAALALAACVAPGVTGAPGVPTRIAVAGGAVTVAGPAGYCIDRGASRSGAEAAFVLLGSCAALSQRAGLAAPDAPALLTASVLAAPSGAGAPDLERMAAFFRTEAGRAALSRSGRAESVEVAESFVRDGVLYLRARDRSAPQSGQGVEPEYWRAVLDLEGRMVTLSVLGAAERPLAQVAKRRTLDAFVRRVRAVNAD